uniref:Uncharacterized protein n=1 Tax=Lactuca sativa TaxID=4236 RepID=A0A9R1UQJ2_LACSA|nr:hypothetical protein LSAT_V11C800395090 [Lactuca sativa]
MGRDSDLHLCALVLGTMVWEYGTIHGVVVELAMSSKSRRTIHGVGARPAACSNSRVYVDHALIEGWHQSSVMEQDTRLPICVFSTTRKGTMVRVHVGIGDGLGNGLIFLSSSTRGPYVAWVMGWLCGQTRGYQSSAMEQDMGLPFRVFSINGQGTMVQVHVGVYAISLMSWNETQDFPFVFSIISTGTKHASDSSASVEKLCRQASIRIGFSGWAYSSLEGVTLERCHPISEARQVEPQLRKCLADDSIVVPLEDIQVDDHLNYIERLVAILDKKKKTL